MKGLADATAPYPLKNPSEDVFGGGVHAKRGVIEIVTRLRLPFDETETLETKTLETKTLEATTTEETTGTAEPRCKNAPNPFRAKICALLGAEGRVERERGDAGDWSRSSTPPLERSHSLDAGVADAPTPESKSSRSLSARMLSLVSGGGGGGSPARGKGPAEIEIEISWSTYEHIKSYSANESSSSARGGGASSASRARSDGETRGSLRVEVSHAEDLCKPRATMTGKMSSESLTPMVTLRVANQSASTATARGLNPIWKEHFDFPGVGMMDELAVSVVHPTSRRTAWGLGRRKSGDRSMGAVLVPVHAVCKAGSVSGVHALEGVKHGEIVISTCSFGSRKITTPSGGRRRSARCSRGSRCEETRWTGGRNSREEGERGCRCASRGTFGNIPS